MHHGPTPCRRAPGRGLEEWKENMATEVQEEDDVIMIIESMKMEIPVEAPCDGTIARICVSEGDSIEEGIVLAVIE
jgi:acetyl-CoA carboxylase biotin carboxyl carrier protein